MHLPDGSLSLSGLLVVALLLVIIFIFLSKISDIAELNFKYDTEPFIFLIILLYTNMIFIFLIWQAR